MLQTHDFSSFGAEASCLFIHVMGHYGILLYTFFSLASVNASMLTRGQTAATLKKFFTPEIVNKVKSLIHRFHEHVQKATKMKLTIPTMHQEQTHTSLHWMKKIQTFKTKPNFMFQQ